MAAHLREHFRKFVRSETIIGVNGEEDEAPCVPLSALERYWTKSRIDDILNSCNPPISENSDMIVKKFLRTFSILVHIGHLQEVSWFFSNVDNLDDYHFPFNEHMLPIPCVWSEAFLKNQWMFFPLNFTHDSAYKRALHSKVILPVKSQEHLTEKRGGRDAAVLWKVQLHPECNSVVPKDEPVVFKVYQGISGEELYKDEANIYNMLHSSNNSYITKHFASFEFPAKQRYIIVLEYAAGGSLLDFFRTTSLPVTPDDFGLLWGRMINLLDALHALNDAHRPTELLPWPLAGVHLDIQPANILVFPQKDKGQRFDVKFKLADFGLAAMGRVSQSGGALATENRGNRMYVSPEAFANFAVQDHVRTKVSAAADIWSLGAVFSDVLVWSIAGEEGQEQYRLRRRQEISPQSNLRASDHDACFHDGEERLSAVQEVHNENLQHKRDSDRISPVMSKLIIDHMLIGRIGRLDAMQIKFRADKEIKKVQDNSSNDASNLPYHGPGATWRQPLVHGNTTSSHPIQSISRTHGSVPSRRATEPPAVQSVLTREAPIAPLLSPQPWDQSMASNRTSLQQSPVSGQPATPERTSSPRRSHQTNVTSMPPEMVTVEKVYSMLEEKDKMFPFANPLGAKSAKSAEIMDLPGMQEARSKIEERQGRDQIMLVDNFTSMGDHKDKIMKTARVVSYVAKIADDNGMELFAASETTKKPRLCKNSTQIEKGIEKMKTVK
ncbi:hypothetical protein FSARC_9641 [Fusarium sarcochroum]|uniref:Protein kinase domain-containing protein n=1 Tax=Fusarium sarcochroum TaxID=1208366 RepID=A0A8H4X529_9HYPO|nr:hypothetical protein FSARC_9641 [Fusarium sarcochroum]